MTNQRIFNLICYLCSLIGVSLSLLACKQVDASKSFENNSITTIEDGYLNDESIKIFVVNNLVSDENDLKYGGGIVFYPNNHGVRFSEGSINLTYTVRDGWICIIEVGSPSNCFRIRKQGDNVFRVRYRDGRATEEKIAVRKFIRKKEASTPSN